MGKIQTVVSPITHIGVDERGVAYIEGTRIKVSHIALHENAGETPQDIRSAYEHLSLAQIYAALSYYFDHKTEIDEQIERADRFVEEMRAQNPNPMTREMFERRLREKVSAKTG